MLICDSSAKRDYWRSLKQGLKVPEPLRKYIPGAPEFIEYTKELPKDSTSQKAKVKKEAESASTSKTSKPPVSSAAASKVADKVAELRV